MAALILAVPIYPALMNQSAQNIPKSLSNSDGTRLEVEVKRPQAAASVLMKPIQFGIGDFATNGEKVLAVKGSLQEALPIDVLQAENLDSVASATGLGVDGMRKLRQNGFVVVRNNFPNLLDGYVTVRRQGLPVFISSDAIIQLNHIFYNSLLAELEEKYLIRSQERLLFALTLEAEQVPSKLPKSSQAYEASRANLEYLYLALGLQNRNLRDSWGFSDRIQKEYNLIDKAEESATSPIFGYLEDYSQYKPRGHYTNSPELTNYFRALTWLSRTRFDLNSDLQTQQALLLTNLLKNTKIGNVSGFSAWQGIYDSTSFFVGESDDLTFQQYMTAMQKIYGSNPSLEELASPAKLRTYQEELRRLDSSRILGTISTKDRALGLRFLGQRFAIDSYIHHALSHDRLESRFMVKGLDIPAAFGSSRAELYLSDEFGKYPDYKGRLESTRVALSGISESEWNRNLYVSSFDSMRTILGQPADGFPSFMRGNAWLDKSLTTFMAGWSLLRHDTLSYTKQTYAAVPAPAPQAPPPIMERPREIIREVRVPTPPHEGYVEPQPYLYSKMKMQADATLNGLRKIGILDNRLETKLMQLSSMMGDLADASIRELKGEELNSSERFMLRTFDEKLTSLSEGLRFPEFVRRAKDPDVFTDPNSGKKLEAETGFLNTILVIYETPEGKMFVGAGVALSYYEFTSEKRLSDEEWTRMLNSGNPPGEPSWIGNYTTNRSSGR